MSSSFLFFIVRSRSIETNYMSSKTKKPPAQFEDAGGGINAVSRRDITNPARRLDTRHQIDADCMDQRT